jgi:hypothetical protein
MATRKKEKSTYIVYEGFSDERSFAKADWERMDIEGQGDVVFSGDNDFRVLKSDLEPEVVEHLLTRERYFSEKEL